MSSAVDEHGRPVSDDGWYVWDGTQWVLRAAPTVAPAPAASGLPTAYAQPVGGDDGLDAELATYTGLQRPWRASVKDLREHLEPGERVLATVGGSGQLVLPAGLALATTLFLSVAAGTMKRGMILCATDRRLLLATTTITGANLQGVQPIGYDQVDRWEAATRDVVVEALGGLRAFPHQLNKAKLARLREVVEPRLRPGVVVGRG